MDLRGISPVWGLCLAQAITTVVAVSIAWATIDRAAAGAALFGGMTAIVPALYFAFKVARKRGVTDADEVLGAFYRAEVGKLFLTLLLFALGVRWFGEHFAPLMLTCVACLAMNWVMLAVAKNQG